MTARVWVVGSLNVDVVCRVDRHPLGGETVLGHELTRRPGGKGANQALAAAHAGAETVLVGAVGDDEAGRAYVDALQRHDVDARVQLVAGAATGHALVVVDQKGENSIVVAPGANSSLRPHDVEEALAGVAPNDVVLLQLEIPLEAVAAAANRGSRAGATVLLNPSPWRQLGQDLLGSVDVLIANESEAAAATDLPASLSVCRTLGAEGADWDGLRLGAEPVHLVDSTGAGDAFAGSLAAGLAARLPRDQMLGNAIRAGGEACTHPGAQPWSF